MVVVCDGNLCLVRGVAGVPRFSEMLAERYPDSSSALAQAVRTARSGGRLIGEVLAELREIPFAHVRECLRDQVTICVATLAAAADPRRLPTFSPLGGSFDERLTFTPLEVFESAAAQLRPTIEQDPVWGIFERHRSSSRFAVLALREQRSLLPVCVDGIDVDHLGDVRSIGRHVAAISSPATLQAAGIRPRLVSFDTGDAFGVLCVGETCVAFLGGLDTVARVRVLREAAELLQGEGEIP